MKTYKIDYTISYSADNITVSSKFSTNIEASTLIEAINIVTSGVLNEKLPTNQLWYDLDFPKLEYTIDYVSNI